ncbi:HTH-type transcriptional repressor [Rhizobiaceae bacterium]|nr:HTH-type transcriptional repressor [Rhizobiaceae bacterium]
MEESHEGSRGKPGRKPSPAIRAAILRAAVALFAERGAEAATTREIAAAAGTTERTLFKHFGSKAGLIQGVIAEVALDLMRQDAFARVYDPQPFTRAELADWHRAFLAERIATAERSPDNYRVLLGELLRDASFRERFSEIWLSSVFAPLVGHLRRMQEAGAIAATQTPEALAGAFFSLNLGYLVSRFALGPARGWTTGHDVEAIAALFLAACGAAAEPANPRR